MRTLFLDDLDQIGQHVQPAGEAAALGDRLRGCEQVAQLQPRIQQAATGGTRAWPIDRRREKGGQVVRFLAADAGQVEHGIRRSFFVLESCTGKALPLARRAGSEQIAKELSER